LTFCIQEYDLGDGLYDTGLADPDETSDLLQNGEVTAIHRENARYCIVLRNKSEHNLFPYVVFFDPYSYAVQTYYRPVSENAPLKAKSSLQLGASAACGEAILLPLDRPKVPETSFVKVCLS
jgi:hypothetical protein